MGCAKKGVFKESVHRAFRGGLEGGNEKAYVDSCCHMHNLSYGEDLACENLKSIGVCDGSFVINRQIKARRIKARQVKAR